MHALEIRLLGALQISLAGGPVLGLKSAKARALLAYLAAEPGPNPRGTLAGLLWSDLPEEDARRNLRVEITKLRQELDPYLVFTRREAMLNPDTSYWTDLHEFTRLATTQSEGPATQRVRQLARAAALYRGDFLSGFQVRAAPLFEEWLLVERERLRQMALALLDQLVEAAIQELDWKTGISAARKSLAIDNWREQSHRQLMTLLALSGDRSAALAQYEATRRTLVQELGIEPGPETTALALRIKEGELDPSRGLGPAIPASATSRWHNLPASTTSFVGRETELEQIGAVLADPGCRLLTLTGPGGIGKTRLALEYCWQQAALADSSYKDGIVYISLAEVVEDNQFVSSLADALHLSISGDRDPQTQVIQFLRDRQMLLVLDNFEQLIEATQSPLSILQAAPRVKLLVTSRHRLNLYEEWVFPTEGMTYPRDEDLSSWQEYGAVQLFLQRARRVNLRFSPEENRDCIVRLCRLLEGLPLGVELAAAWVHALPCDTIYDLIHQNLSLPESQLRNLPARQRSLQAVFQYSWDMLSEDEQRSLASLPVFQGGFSAPAAGTVAKAHPRLLASLAGKSLLRFSPNGRYEMHVLLHSFFGEKLASAEKGAAQSAHCQYFARLLADNARAFAGPNEGAAIETLAAEISNLRAGWAWLIARISNLPPETDRRELLDLVALVEAYTPALSMFLSQKSWFREAETLFSPAAKALEAAGFSTMQPVTRAPMALGLVYLAQARHQRALGRFDRARALISKSLPLFSLYADCEPLADAWSVLGQVEQYTGALEAAEKAYQTSLEIARRLQNQTGIAGSLVDLGVLAKLRGDLNQAASLYGESLEIFRSRGDGRGVWTCLINLGNIANVRQDYREAQELYDQANAIATASTDLARQALTLLNLGSVAREMDANEQALAFYQDSLRISEEIGEVRIQAGSLDGLGKTCLNMGDLEPAGGYLRRALQVELEADLLPQALASLATAARLAARKDQTALAISILQYVATHPACPAHVKQEAEGELEASRLRIPDQMVREASEVFRDAPIETVIARVG